MKTNDAYEHPAKSTDHKRKPKLYRHGKPIRTYETTWGVDLAGRDPRGITGLSMGGTFSGRIQSAQPNMQSIPRFLADPGAFPLLKHRVPYISPSEDDMVEALSFARHAFPPRRFIGPSLDPEAVLAQATVIMLKRGRRGWQVTAVQGESRQDAKVRHFAQLYGVQSTALSSLVDAVVAYEKKALRDLVLLPVEEPQLKGTRVPLPTVTAENFLETAEQVREREDAILREAATIAAWAAV